MKTVIDIIKVDLITMRGGKNNSLSMLAFTVIIFGLLGFVFDAATFIMLPLFLGVGMVPWIFNNETKYHSKGLFSLLPIRRSQLVSARFMLVLGSYTLLAAAGYLLMWVSLKLKLYSLFLGEGNSAAELLVSGGALKNLGLDLTLKGLYNLLFFTFFAFGIIACANLLSAYFRGINLSDTGFRPVTDKKEKKYQSRSLVLFLAVLAVITLFWLMLTGVLPMGYAALVIVLTLTQLMQAADGFLLGAVLLFVGVFHAFYKYVQTILEYDEFEL